MYDDRKRRGIEFEEGDRVYLDTSDLSLKEGQVRKLTENRIGPYVIKKKLSPVNYVLDLPKEYSRIHATFHISKLSKAQEGMRVPVDDEGEEKPAILEIGPIDGTDLWVVENIVDREWRWHSYANGTGKWNAYYLVKWKGFPLRYECVQTGFVVVQPNLHPLMYKLHVAKLVERHPTILHHCSSRQYLNL